MVLGVPEGSRGFKRVPEGSRGFKRVPEGSRGFKRVPEGSRGFQRVPEGSREFQRVPGIPLPYISGSWGPKCSRGFQIQRVPGTPGTEGHMVNWNPLKNWFNLRNTVASSV